MTTLREEISNQLVKPFDKGLNDFKDFDEYQRYLHNVLINRMISIFVKLIDEKIKPLEKEQRNRTSINEYNSFAITKLKELKKELKK